MAFRVVLDACVRYPCSLRDTLLRLAEAELYEPFWSGRILDEMARNLVEDGRMTPERTDRVVRLMREAFEEAEVPATAVEQLGPAMTDHLKDFPVRACAHLGVRAVHPDEFLSALLAAAPRVVIASLRQQAGDLDSPPITLDELLRMLATTAPTFVVAVGHQL